MSRIREIRIKRNMSQFELADKIGISQGALSLIERDEKTVTLDTAAKISIELGYSVEFLWPEKFS